MKNIPWFGLVVVSLIALTPATSRAAAPRLQFQKNIGDMRGKGMDNISVAVAEDGTIYLLMAGGRVAVFDKNGKYRESQKIQLPSPPWTSYLGVTGKRVLLGDYIKDYPWVFSAERKGSGPGAFMNPKAVVQDENGKIYVADTGNCRIQVFDPEKIQTPKKTIPLKSQPLSVALRKNLLAVITADKMLEVYDLTAAPFDPKASAAIGPGAVCVAVSPTEDILVGFRGGGGNDRLRHFKMSPEGLVEKDVIASSHMEDWPNFFPAGVPLTKGPGDLIWFATSYSGARILALDPRSDKVEEKFKKLPGPILAVGFDAEGRTYAGGYAQSGEGPSLWVFEGSDPMLPGERWGAGPLYADRGVPIWGLLPDRDGGIYVRVVDEGYGKGWPVFTVKKVYRDGKSKNILTFSSGLYCGHPSGAGYSLRYDPQGNLLAALPLRAVVKFDPTGKIIWRAGLAPEGGADQIEFSYPRDVALDSKGNAWVVDSGENKVFCLSPAGKLLLEYGGLSNVDDLQGRGFDSPSGIAAVTVDGQEYLYVGDSGNQRLVKYRIIW